MKDLTVRVKIPDFNLSKTMYYRLIFNLSRINQLLLIQFVHPTMYTRCLV